MDSAREGHRVRCRACGTELEVVDVDPLELDFADWRDERRAEDRRRSADQEREWLEQPSSPDRYEGTPLHRAAYGDHDLSDL
jgi:hypothetical protein